MWICMPRYSLCYSGVGIPKEMLLSFFLFFFFFNFVDFQVLFC